MGKKENLLSKDLYGKYYATMEAVKENVERYDNLISGMRNPDSDIFFLLTTRLERLYNTLVTQEEEFYRSMNITNNRAEGIKQIQQRIDEWNAKANIMFDKSTIDGVFEIVVNRIDTAAIIEFLNTELGDVIDLEIRENSAYQDDIAKIFSSIFEKNFRSSSTMGLNTVLEIYNNGSGFRVRQKNGNKNLGNGVAKKILEAISQQTSKKIVADKNMIDTADRILKQAGGSEYNETTAEIRQYLKTKIPDSEIFQYISRELDRDDQKNYARWANYFVIKGYLGELYWNACIGYIFNSPQASIPAGNIKNLAGKSLSVDMLFKNTGFQIKSWNLKNAEIDGELFDTHTSINSMQFGKFLASRAQILENEVGKTVARMFGSISYNLPDLQKGADEVALSQSETYKEFYNRADRSWPNTMDELSMLFQNNLSEIIGISGSGGQILENGQIKQYYNTFWAINNKIIPSSVIIRELIESLEQAKHTSLVELGVNLVKKVEKPVWDDDNLNFADEQMANRWKIDYSTRFNLTKLLEQAALKA